ncbi:MAG: hypothetical protein M1820_006282 [Bogoriella megaspora]|nr:MAG: hypothetical protein M1820_006282 [Bogoriella megaspora]
MHFEITEASNGQSLNPFNSGIFHVSNGSSISTSSLFSSESPATASSIPSTSAVPTRGPILTSALVASSSSSSASSSVLSFVQEREDGTRKLGFGLGLGLGLPLLLIILGLAVFFVLKRKTASSPRQPQEATARPGTSPPHYGHEYGVPRTQEFDAQAAVVEVPAVISYEFPGSEVRHELSAEVAGTSASMFLPNPSQSRTS